MSQIDLNYQKPSAEILALVEAPLPPLVRMNTKGTIAVFLHRELYKSIAEISAKEMRLGGLRINPVTNISSRAHYYAKLTIKNIAQDKTQKVKGLPEKAQIAHLSWSPNEKMMAFTNTTDKGVALWVLDIAKREVRQLTKAVLNANLGVPFMWRKNNKSLLVHFLPKDKKALIDLSLIHI